MGDYVQADLRTKGGVLHSLGVIGWHEKSRNREARQAGHRENHSWTLGKESGLLCSYSHLTYVCWSSLKWEQPYFCTYFPLCRRPIATRQDCCIASLDHPESELLPQWIQSYITKQSLAEQCSFFPSLNCTEFSSKKETKLSQVEELSLVSIGESEPFYHSGHSNRDLSTNRNRPQIFDF